MGLGFFYIMYTARYLGAEGFGVLSFALAFTGMFGVFGDMGLSILTTREVARDKSLAGKYLGNIAVMKVVLVVITFGLIAIAINLLGYPEQTIKVVYLIALSIIFSAFTGMFNSVFQAFERMEYQSIGGILSSVLMLAGALIAISQGFSVVGFAAIYSIVSAVGLGYSFIVCLRKFVLPVIEINLGFWKILLKEALPFAITGISISIYIWIDTIMLSLLIGDEVVGWYNAAYKLVLMLLFIPVIVNNSIFPLMSQYYRLSKDSLRILFEKLFKIMMFIGLPLGMGTLFLADKIILLIYGDQFINSILALQILIWSMVLIFTRSPFERLLEASNKQATVTKIFIIGAIFNVAGNLILIPKYSYIGAGVATVFTDIIVLVFLVIATKNFGVLISKKELFGIVKIIFASVIMGIFIKYSLSLNVFIIIISATIIYIMSSIFLKSINKDDIVLIKSVFKK